MNLITRNNLKPYLKNDILHSMMQETDKFFNEFFNNSHLNGVKANSGYPKMTVWEDDNKFNLSAAVPGVKAEDLEVELLGNDGENRTLTISGSVTEKTIENSNAYVYIRELRESKFSRQLTLPERIRGEPEAVLKDGILTLTWLVEAKKEEKKKLISVKTES